MTACALPLRRCSWQTMTGAARVVLGVKVPAAMQGTSESKMARSLIEASDLMPQAVTPARNPWGAVTQLSISRNVSDKESTSMKIGADRSAGCKERIVPVGWGGTHAIFLSPPLYHVG